MLKLGVGTVTLPTFCLQSYGQLSGNDLHLGLGAWGGRSQMPTPHCRHGLKDWAAVGPLRPFPSVRDGVQTFPHTCGAHKAWE